MSSLEGSSPFGSSSATDRNTTPPSAGWHALEELVARGSERLNPILVKEARQALKSKQFVITFTLLLLAGWVWSMLGVALLSPGVYYAPGGRFMLIGYFIILSIPVLVNVPFSAFRSLASEREDGTFELLSITALSARQIVTGKLGSAILQMLVYFSALAPCIAFTYLLRGIDIITIAFLLFYTFVASVMLAAFGLVVATVTRARHWQVLLSVLLLIGLLLVTFIWTLTFSQLIAGQPTGFDEFNFWLVQAAIVTFCVSNAALFIMIAAAQISFASDNRSTRLRIMLLIQHVMWIAWQVFFWIHWESFDVLYSLVTVAGIYWYIVGAFSIGETASLSPRVKRSLPQSFAGRMCLTWFNPGSGTGYVFCVTNLAALLAVTGCAGTYAEINGYAGAKGNFDWLLFALLLGAYVTIYLGVARLLVLLLKQVGHVTMLLTVLIVVFLAIFGCALPTFFQAWLEGYARMTYSALQITNWWWTLYEASRGNLSFSDFVPIATFVTAGIVFFNNLLFAIVEVEQVRQTAPDRVLQDERERRPPRPLSKPKSPWDAEAAK